jgi:hypothetical protein
MTYRAFDTGTWKDPWFEQLSIKAKLLFIYLWTNDICTQSGVYCISPRRVEFESGLEASKILPELSIKVRWFEEQSIVWVMNFFRKQCANPKFAIAAIRSLSYIPKPIVDEFTQYNLKFLKRMGIDTLSIPYREGTDRVALSVTGSVTEEVTEKLKETTSCPNSGVRRASKQAGLGGFEAFWTAYPKKTGRLAAKKAWDKLNGTRPSTEAIVAKVEELKKSEQWLKDGGQYIPLPTTWLNQGRWDDEVICGAGAGKKKTIKYSDIDKELEECNRRDDEWSRKLLEEEKTKGKGSMI